LSLCDKFLGNVFHPPSRHNRIGLNVFLDLDGIIDKVAVEIRLAIPRVVKAHRIAEPDDAVAQQRRNVIRREPLPVIKVGISLSVYKLESWHFNSIPHLLSDVDACQTRHRWTTSVTRLTGEAVTEDDNDGMQQ
jgi:hypothetical protein